ncbi:MAG TPA: signal recognition particle-docking protein FtsY [Pirellulales bacterium]|nr:signal recognition particle-docking protein FtsY [Pirellulales bacterium]
MGLFDRFKKSTTETTEPAQSDVAPAVTQSPSDDQPKSLFAKFKDGLRKTHQLLNTDIRDLFKKEGRLVDDDFLAELRAILIRTDMGPSNAATIVDEIHHQFRARMVHLDDVLAVIKTKLRELLVQNEAPIRMSDSGVTVIMVCGVNGSGKTTSIAKLAHMFRAQGKNVVLGAGDTFRAAAVEQLTIWAQRLGVEIVTGPQGSDPASVAHRALGSAVEKGADVCIIDTAGRLQTQQNLMKELTKIHRVLGNKVPGAPHEVLLVLDATSGQNAISQARGFTEAVQCTGIVLSKIDGTAKGGVVIPIRQQFGLPVKYVGVGEKAEDLALFQPDAFVEALFSGLTAETAAAQEKLPPAHATSPATIR